MLQGIVRYCFNFFLKNPQPVLTTDMLKYNQRFAVIAMLDYNIILICSEDNWRNAYDAYTLRCSVEEYEKLQQKNVEIDTFNGQHNRICVDDYVYIINTTIGVQIEVCRPGLYPQV